MSQCSMLASTTSLFRCIAPAFFPQGLRELPDNHLWRCHTVPISLYSQTVVSFYKSTLRLHFSIEGDIRQVIILGIYRGPRDRRYLNNFLPLMSRFNTFLLFVKSGCYFCKSSFGVFPQFLCASLYLSHTKCPQRYKWNTGKNFCKKILSVPSPNTVLQMNTFGLLYAKLSQNHSEMVQLQ